MPSNARKGAYYKSRTKKWLLAQGWQVAHMELVRTIGWPVKFAVKQDQFGSDLLAMDPVFGLWFIQVKGGAAARTGNFPDARRSFASFRFPHGTRQVVLAWAPGAREPRIVDMTVHPPEGAAADGQEGEEEISRTEEAPAAGVDDDEDAEPEGRTQGRRRPRRWRKEASAQAGA